MCKVCVIGIDGATFDIIEPLIKMGELPNLEKLVSEGVHGNLASVYPPMTAPAWVSFATGRLPGKHGCIDFTMPGDTLDEVKPISSQNIRGETFYKILEQHGKRCVLINLPCSYPPRIKGVVLTSILTKAKNFIFPPTLKEEIPELRKYEMIFDLLAEVRKSDIARFARRMHNIIFSCAKRLFKEIEWDFFFVMFYGVDMLQHRRYGEMISELKYESPNWLTVFKQLDNYVGWFLRTAPKNTILLIISDHGFQVYKGSFLPNVWLKNEGYLRVKRKKIVNKKGEELGGSFPRKELRNFLLQHPRVTDTLYSILEKLSINVFDKPLETLAFLLSRNFTVDLEKTLAYCSPQLTFFGIYINDKERFRNGLVRGGEEYERISEEIIKKMKTLKEEGCSEPLFKDVKRREDFSFRNIKEAPDIIYELDDYWIKPYYFVFPKQSIHEAHNHHSKNGIFIANGPKIKTKVQIDDAQLIDIAPTILHLMEIPIPEDMDGKILSNILK